MGFKNYISVCLMSILEIIVDNTMKNITKVHKDKYNTLKKNQNVFYECIPCITNLS